MPPRYRALLVDDDPALLDVTSALIEDDFVVTCATSGKEALELIAAGGIDIICADFKMPVMNGVELLARVEEMAPSVARVLITGMTEHAEGPFGVIHKPYKPSDLSLQLMRAIERPLRRVG